MDVGQPTTFRDTTASNIRWSRVAPTLLVVWIVSTFDKSNMPIVLNDPGFLREFGLAGQQTRLGMLGTALFVSYGLCAPVWGLVVDRIGARRAAALSLAAWSAACFWSGAAGSYGELLLSRIALGAGEAALYPFTVKLVASWFPLRERGRATSFWWIGNMIGPMLVGLVVTSLIATVGWRAQFRVMGVLSLALPLPMILLFVRDTPSGHPGVLSDETLLIEGGSVETVGAAAGRGHRPEASVWRNHRFWLTTAAMAANAVFFWGWAFWLPTYLRTIRHFSFNVSGYLTFVIFGFAVVTVLSVGRLSDRIFRRAGFICIGCLLAAIFLLGAAFAPSAGMSVVLMILALCMQQVGISCCEMLMHSVVPSAGMGRTQGLRALITIMTGGAAPTMMGIIVETTGGFAGGFAVLASAMIFASACMLPLLREGL